MNNEFNDKANDIERLTKARERFVFEQTCLIDRDLIYNSLIFIINNYEIDISARQDKIEEWESNYDWSELYGYHRLIINDEVIYSALIDSRGCYPDEENCGLYLDMKKKEKICFFDLKRSFSLITENHFYIKELFALIESLYTVKRNITITDIEEILAKISNEKKKKKILIKKNRFYSK